MAGVLDTFFELIFIASILRAVGLIPPRDGRTDIVGKDEC